MSASTSSSQDTSLLTSLLKLRLPALLCSLAVLFCTLTARPFTSMGVSDDWPYIVSARTLATTGHIVYTGWATAMIGWQLYLAAAFIKLFGYSPTTVRMSTLFVAVLIAFLLQRCFVRCNLTERNATLATLTLVLSPIYLMLSVTYMTDINGLFAIVLCLYGCLRALQAATPQANPAATLAWIFFALASNTLCGTSRQIAWLGVLVMVPSTLWLLRSRRRVFIAGLAATAACALAIFACLHWLYRQPYFIPDHPAANGFSFVNSSGNLYDLFLEVPFFLLPIAVLFLPELRRLRPRTLLLFTLLLSAYLYLAIDPHHLRRVFVLEPTAGSPGGWVGIHGIHEGMVLWGQPPVFLHTGTRLLLTLLSFAGALGLIASLLNARRPPVTPTPTPRHAPQSYPGLTARQLSILLIPFGLAYMVLLIPRSSAMLFDRYLLGLLIVPLALAVRFYQDHLHRRLPLAGFAIVALLALYAIVTNHNQFMLYRARVALAAEIRAAGLPDTSVDNGWEYNFGVELQHAPYINDDRIEVPANAYRPIAPPPPGPCPMFWREKTPSITPLYGISFDPSLCDGPAPFAPLTYPRWFGHPVTLYVVRYTPATLSRQPDPKP